MFAVAAYSKTIFERIGKAPRSAAPAADDRFSFQGTGLLLPKLDHTVGSRRQALTKVREEEGRHPIEGDLVDCIVSVAKNQDK